jgi:epsilon-lactone hydrolase
MHDTAVQNTGPTHPSFRARLLSGYIRLAIKPKSRNGFDVGWARRVLGKPVVPAHVPRGIVIESTLIGAISAEIIHSARREGAQRTILFLHGGGYYFGSSISHRAITLALAELTDARIVSVNYRLAPEHPFPAALDDATAAVLALYASGVSHHQLAVCGDSAGGGLALSLLLRLRDTGAPLPACAVLFSPWTDLAATGASLYRNDRSDPLFHGSCIAHDARHYLAGEDPRNPGASPLYADLAGLPPLLIQVSRTEILLDDSLRLARKAKLSGVDVRCQVWTDLPHVWQLHCGLIPEAKTALRSAGQHIIEQTV